MALSKNALFELAKTTALADSTSPVAYTFGENQFSYNELNDLLRKELNELGGTYALYRENKNTIFALLEQTIDAVLPKRVDQQYGLFAEIKQFGNTDLPRFTQRITAAAKTRALQFITRVGLAGRYDVFKLDGKTIDVEVCAYGGAAQISFEEFLDGTIQMSDLLDIVLEGLDRAIFREIKNALAATVAKMPAANVASYSGFDEATFDGLLAIADAYGKSTIYTSYKLAAKMVPQTNWISDEMRNERWSNGYLANYKGHQVIVFNQSFEDANNTTPVMDEEFAYIFAAGADKPVKIALVGQTAVREADNEDWSKEIQTYKKLGVGILATNNICRYEDSSL